MNRPDLAEQESQKAQACVRSRVCVSVSAWHFSLGVLLSTTRIRLDVRDSIAAIHEEFRQLI